MLKRLKLENFKAFESLDLELAPVTVLFGPNSAGKSSIEQFILMLKQTKESTDRSQTLALDGPYVNLGTFADLIHRHDESRTLGWSLEWEYWEELAVPNPDDPDAAPLATSQTLSVSSRIVSEKQAPVAKSLSYTLDGYSFDLQPQDGKPDQFDLTAHGPTEYRFKKTIGRKWKLPGPLKCYAYPDQIRTYYQNAGFLADLEYAFEEQFSYVYYLGPLRVHPSRNYQWSRSRPADVGERGERAIEAILAATLDNQKHNLRPRAKLMPFQEIVAHWLREMGLIHSFRVEEIAPGTNYWVVKLTTSEGGPEVSLTDVGFGLSQVLPVIVQLYYVSTGSTVLIEQPELHLHPRAQGVLADLILSVAERRELQVIVETHSEHFLMRLQRRIAEETASASDTKLYFCSSARGKSIAEPLRLNNLGEIENWPENFFGDAFGETAAAEEARLKRMMRS